MQSHLRCLRCRRPWTPQPAEAISGALYWQKPGTGQVGPFCSSDCLSVFRAWEPDKQLIAVFGSVARAEQLMREAAVCHQKPDHTVAALRHRIERHDTWGPKHPLEGGFFLVEWLPI